MTDLRDRLQSQLDQTYSFERELPGGGMAHVFAAEERAFGRHVVIKVIRPELPIVPAFFREVLSAE